MGEADGTWSILPHHLLLVFFTYFHVCLNVYLGYVKLSEGLKVPNRVGNRHHKTRAHTGTKNKKNKEHIKTGQIDQNRRMCHFLKLLINSVKTREYSIQVACINMAQNKIWRIELHKFSSVILAIGSSNAAIAPHNVSLLRRAYLCWF